MNDSYILVLDQSTSATKAMLVNKAGHIVSKQSKEHQQFYPQPGWVEHDPEEIYDNSLTVIKKVLRNVKDINCLQALALTNQRETVLIWDKDTGKPIYNAIVWQCNRTEDICTELKNEQLNNMLKKKTGLLLDPYFSATKIKWLLENVDGAREKAAAGSLKMGTIDSWLIWNLTGGKVHATDYTNASRTLLFNIDELSWDEKLLDVFDIPVDILPEVKSSDAVFGCTNISNVISKEIPITGVVGDSQGALFGQKCFKTGTAKATYGTGTSVLMNTGEELVLKDNLVTSIAWGLDDKVNYVFEGIIRSSGDTLKWVKDNLGLFADFKEVEPLINELDDNEGVYLVPAFSGLGIPYWDMTARAAVTGMTKKTDKRHIIRAAVEAIAYQVTDAIKLMSKESGINLKELMADGGATVNSFLMQFQADLLNKKVLVPQIAELSAMGAVYLAGLSTGIWESTAEIEKLNNDTEIYEPQLAESLRDRYYEGWEGAVKRVLTN